MKKRTFCYAFKQSVPIMCSYLFLSFAFGIMVKEAGFNAIWAVLISAIIYTGAFQFVLVPFIVSGTSVVTILLTALFMNSRHLFYGLSYIDEFKKMGKKYPYMIFTLTDETYSVNCSCTFSDGIDREQAFFYIAFLSRIYWITGTIFGSLAGYIIPFDLTGIDFCMTAFFVTIVIDQWKKANNHMPAITGALTSLVFLYLLGASNFILPSLLTTVGILLFYRKKGKGYDGQW